MNAKLSPAASAAILLLAIGIIAAVMWVAVDQKGPPLPIGPGQPTPGAGGQQDRGASRRGPGQGQPGKTASNKKG